MLYGLLFLLHIQHEGVIKLKYSRYNALLFTEQIFDSLLSNWITKIFIKLLKINHSLLTFIIKLLKNLFFKLSYYYYLYYFFFI